MSHGLAHLQGLADAGLNHIHLLPSYDFGSVPERGEEQAHVMVRGSGCVCWGGGCNSTCACTCIKAFLNLISSVFLGSSRLPCIQ